MKFWFYLECVKLACVALVINEVASEPLLKQLHIAFRHGERAPTYTFPNDPYINFTWPGGLGQLTNNGKQQMYLLGQMIRLEYAKFIPKIFWHQDVNITSSYSERCQMSGQLFCAGLFPPIESQIWNKDLLWQPIPVSYLPRAQDTTIVMKAVCPKYDELFKEIRLTPDIVALENSYKDLKAYLTKQTGNNITNIEDIESLFNTLEIEKLQNLTLPNWVNDSMMATMKELGARNLALYSETQYMKKVKGGVFLNNMLRVMEKSLNGTDNTILYLYAVHDLSIVHILRSLGLIDTLKPGFGATLIFELYDDGKVMINYRNEWNGSPQLLAISQCNQPCKLNEFKAFLENVLSNDYNKDCALDNINT